MSNGWIKLHRQIQSHWLWESSSVTYFHAWTDMLLSAAHKPHKQLIKKQIVNVSTGELAWSESFMQNRWKWSRNKVRLFLDNLKKDEMIVLNKGNKKVHLTSVISICNYSNFQSTQLNEGTTKGTSQGIAKDTAKGTGEGTQDKKVNKDKNIKNKKNLDFLCKSISGFSDKWNEYKQHRVELKKKLTPTSEYNALLKLIRFNEKKMCVITILDNSISNGWTGIFESDNKKKFNDNQGKPFREFGT